jgi:hypothetical protein
MANITNQQHENLVQKIYETLISLPYFDENNEMCERGMGEMGETRDEAKRIVNEWIKENNISLTEN